MNLGSTVRKIVACGGFDTSAVNLRDLKFDSSVAKLLREEFAKMMDERKPRIYTLQEAKGLTGFGPLSGKVSHTWIAFFCLVLLTFRRSLRTTPLL